ncbi:hypothetical protein [Vogesella oryzae]|uniref:hypothetical protein n=1 Tax=Vogesella oryzae TaxID=1735285 RepID=UPI0015824796|nr:hypothetical protein [Vogesella oryzae]
MFSRNSRHPANQVLNECPTKHPNQRRLAPLTVNFSVRSSAKPQAHRVHPAAQPDLQSKPPR